MTLRELIIQYRTDHGISQRQFATLCGISNGYLSMLERGINPKTEQPPIPSLQVLEGIARGMGISITDLFIQAEDMPVDMFDVHEKVPAPELRDGHDAQDNEIISLLLKLSPEKKTEALHYLRYLSERAEN